MLGVLVLLISAVLGLLGFLGVTWYESSRAEIPPGAASPQFLRRMNRSFTGVLILGKILEKLGVCYSTSLIEFSQRISRVNAKDDPEVSKKDVEYDGVRVRVYRPRPPTTGGRKGVVFFHGGGFVTGSIDSYDTFCQYLTKNSGAVVVSVGYRLAPEHRYPAAFDDCLSATIHFLKTAEEHGVDPSSVIICGDSAGGNLTAGVCQALVGRSDIPKPLAQVLIYPAVQMADLNLPSYQQNKMAPLVPREKAVHFIMIYMSVDLTLYKEVLGGRHVPPDMRQKLREWLGCEEFTAKGYKPPIMAPFREDVYQRAKKALEPPCSPLFSDDAVIRQLPQAYILTCEFDVLRDDGLLYKKRLEDNGVPVTWYHVQDGFHGIVSFFDQPEVVSGKLAMDNVIAYIKGL